MGNCGGKSESIDTIDNEFRYVNLDDFVLVRAIGKGGFVGASAEGLTVLSLCPKTGRAQAQKVCAATAMAAGSDTKVAINGFGRIGRNVLRCWLKRETKPFDIVAINVGSMGSKTAAHLLKYDTVLGMCIYIYIYYNTIYILLYYIYIYTQRINYIY